MQSCVVVPVVEAVFLQHVAVETAFFVKTNFQTVVLPETCPMLHFCRAVVKSVDFSRRLLGAC